MAFMKRIKNIAALALILIFSFPAGALALAQAENGPALPKRTQQVILIVIDGLQSDMVNSSLTPNINGLGMAGIMAEKVSVMPPDTPDCRFYSLLCGSDIQGQSGPGEKKALLGGTLLSNMEKKGIKTAVIDGTGQFGKALEGVSFSVSGPFKDDGEVIDRAVDTIKNKSPFLTVIVLSGPGKERALTGTKSKAFANSVTAADNEVGRLLRRLHIDGVYEESLLVVAGTTGTPPLIIKGGEFLTGTKLPPVCQKDLAPTLGYLYGISLPEAKGLIIWNAFQPGPDNTESFMLFKRIADLSQAYANNIDEAARLENEKVLVQEEKARLTRDKQSVEDEITQRDRRINELSLIISIMKVAILLGIVIFVAALLVEYRILKKRYLFFT